jgi:hypothetical protein
MRTRSMALRASDNARRVDDRRLTCARWNACAAYVGGGRTARGMPTREAARTQAGSYYFRLLVSVDRVSRSEHGPWAMETRGGPTPSVLISAGSPPVSQIAFLRQLNIEPGKGSDTYLKQECAKRLPQRPFYQCRARYVAFYRPQARTFDDPGTDTSLSPPRGHVKSNVRGLPLRPRRQLRNALVRDALKRIRPSHVRPHSSYSQVFTRLIHASDLTHSFP